MLLAIDIGNTQTAIGLYGEDDLVGQWRLTTDVDRTPDETRLWLRSLLEMEGFSTDSNRRGCPGFRGACRNNGFSPVRPASGLRSCPGDRAWSKNWNADTDRQPTRGWGRQDRQCRCSPGALRSAGGCGRLRHVDELRCSRDRTVPIWAASSHPASRSPQTR